jgi:DNA-binding Lrp family transcriptional regulator
MSDDRSLDQLGKAVGLSRNVVWRRIKTMEVQAVIIKSMKLIDLKN